MNQERKHSNIILVSMVALVIGLTGCGDSTQTPTATATIPPVDPTATTQIVLGSVLPTVGSVTTAIPTATNVTGACAKLNLNSETEAELTTTIPNFSSRMVREFFEYRPYVSIQQFRREIGKYVDASQVAEYEKYVYVPVDPNASDAETLKQLP